MSSQGRQLQPLFTGVLVRWLLWADDECMTSHRPGGDGRHPQHPDQTDVVAIVAAKNIKPGPNKSAEKSVRPVRRPSGATITSEGAGRSRRQQLTKTDPVSPEWTQGDASLLEWLVGPRKESFPNTRLELSEREDINVRLEKLLEHLKAEQDFTEKQLEAIKAALDEARKADGQIGRKDWLLLGIGALATLAISTVLPPPVAVHISKLFIHEVAHLFGDELAH